MFQEVTDYWKNHPKDTSSYKQYLPSERLGKLVVVVFGMLKIIKLTSIV
jgi:hypothetical protein